MLEQHIDLIEHLLRGSSTRTQEFNQGWSFTNDGTLYFSVWEKDGRMFFSRSERQPSTGFDLDTDCDSVAAYVLTTQLGAKRAMALHFDVPRFPKGSISFTPHGQPTRPHGHPPSCTTALRIPVSAFTRTLHPLPYPPLTRWNTTSKTS